MVKKSESEVAAIEAALLQSINQMQRREYVHVWTPVQLQTIRARTGWPYGAKQAAPVRVATTLRAPVDTFERWRACGMGWQTRVAELLKAHAPQQRNKGVCKSTGLVDPDRKFGLKHRSDTVQTAFKLLLI